MLVRVLALFSSRKVTAESFRVLLIVRVRKSRQMNPKEYFVECDCVGPLLDPIGAGSFDVEETASIADRDAVSPFDLACFLPSLLIWR